LLGAIIAAVFANDGAALILTPIVIQMLRALNFPAKAALGFVLACGFIADAGSLPLVVSNLVNIVSADFFSVNFARYAIVMVPVGAVTVLASLGVLFLYFGRSIPKSYDTTALPAPTSAISDPLVFRTGWFVLVFLLIGYFVGDPLLHIPLSAIAGVGAVVLVAVAARQPAFLFPRSARIREAVPAAVGGAALGYETGDPRNTAGLTVEIAEASLDARERRIPVAKVIREAPWQIVLFSIGMYLVVFGLRNQGLTSELAGVFRFFGDQGTLITALGVGVVIAALASLMNNMPTVLIAALAVAATGATGLSHELMVYANIVGSDLGPKITPIGSLATLLWLHVLDRKGIHIGWGRYFRTGIVLTLPVLVISLLSLAGWLSILG
jgi:arsenical pump membrane protein